MLEWGRTAIVNLTNVTVIEFPAAGHSVTTDNPCAMHITASFLDNPDIKPDLSCVETAPQPGFVLPDEIIIAPSMYEIHFGELGYSILEENIFLGGWLILIVTGIIAIIAGLVKLMRWRKQTSVDIGARFAHPLLIILPLTALAWGYMLRYSLQTVASKTSNILRLGLPVAYWWIFVIAIIIGLMTIGLMVITALVWKRRCWSWLGRIAISGTTLAAITFSGMLAYWGFFTALFR